MMMIKPTSSWLPLRNQTLPPHPNPPPDLSWNALQRYTIVGKCQTFISYTTSSLPIRKLAKSCTWAPYGIWESGNFHFGIYMDWTWLREHPAINLTFIKGLLLNFCWDGDRNMLIRLWVAAVYWSRMEAVTSSESKGLLHFFFGLLCIWKWNVMPVREWN